MASPNSDPNDEKKPYCTEHQPVLSGEEDHFARIRDFDVDDFERSISIQASFSDELPPMMLDVVKFSPTVGLPQQSRIHPVLMQVLSRRFYDGKLEFSGNEHDFALIDGYEGMIRKLTDSLPIETLNEDELRLVWLETPGKNTRRSNDTASRANLQNFLFAMELIKGPYHEMFGESMHDQVGVLMPYKRQLDIYSIAFNELRCQGWTPQELPKLLMCDASIGEERNYIIHDIVVSGKDREAMGFTRDVRRMCIANTRARKAVLFIGSDLPETESSTRSRRNKLRRARNNEAVFTPYDKYGNYREEFILPEFHSFIARHGSLIYLPAKVVHEFDWPIDLWSKDYSEAFEAVKKVSHVEYGAGGYVRLTDVQKDLVYSEYDRIEKLKAKMRKQGKLPM